NDEWIYHVNYPHYYYGFNRQDIGSTAIYDFSQAIPVDMVPQKDFEFLRDYVLGLSEEEKQEGDTLAYAILLHYYDENGETEMVYVEGYDAFPEGFDTFVERVNKVCGANYLTGSGSLQEVTPEFLHEVWGVTDDDVPGGTLADLIEQEEIDMKKLTEDFHMESALYSFYAGQKEAIIAPYRATELCEAGSTEEEYDKFIASFERELSEKGYELKESAGEAQDQDYMVRYGDFYIAKTSDFSKMTIKEPEYEGDNYHIVLDAHMEGMTMSADFIYSRDGKFILIDCNDVDIQEAFVTCGE
nr:hypothetical protein [Lachnospiraceae bacterium]